jgi:hypothetical protein
MQGEQELSEWLDIYLAKTERCTETKATPLGGGLQTM